MKSMKRFFALALAAVMCLCSIPAVYAAPVADATIDTDAKASLTVFKYDITNGATRS